MIGFECTTQFLAQKILNKRLCHRSSLIPRTFSQCVIFPLASGHINPSLAIARSLVQEGHDVHYLCREQMREAIEDTGAVFHSDIETQPELYAGRDPSMWGALGSLQEEYGMKGESFSQARLKMRELAAELMLPGTLRWLEKIKARAVLCDPLINLEAPLAAKAAGIPCASLLTVAGPGGQEVAWGGVLKAYDCRPSLAGKASVSRTLG
eukprot:s571_g23.t1